MQHIFEFKMKHKSGEQLHFYLNTESSRNTKASKKALEEVNRVRTKSGLEPWKTWELEEFLLKKHR